MQDTTMKIDERWAHQFFLGVEAVLFSRHLCSASSVTPKNELVTTSPPPRLAPRSTLLTPTDQAEIASAIKGRPQSYARYTASLSHHHCFLWKLHATIHNRLTKQHQDERRFCKRRLVRPFGIFLLCLYCPPHDGMDFKAGTFWKTEKYHVRNCFSCCLGGYQNR